MADDKPKIFIVDNELEICNLLKDFFDFIGYESAFETDGEKAMELLEILDYDVMFVDLRLETISGIELLKKSKQVRPLAEVIVVTGYGTEETILTTLRFGASSYIQKPISFSEIRVQTEEALARRRFRLRTDSVRHTLGEASPELLEHFENLVKLDSLTEYVNLTFEITILAESILNGIECLAPGQVYTFLFSDNINKEMVLYPSVPVSQKVLDTLQEEVRAAFEKLSNTQIGDECHVRVIGQKKPASGASELDGGLTNLFVPILVENTIHGMLGVSGTELVRPEIVVDMLRIVSRRLSHVLTNATVHRDTKLLAITDGLTGLLNRSAFHERLEGEFERFRRYGTFLSLIVADFDNLKQINDSYGHPVGDEVIKKIGDILRETTRDSDILTRYGGDEFVIVLPQTNTENALNMAERIRRKIEQHVFRIDEHTFQCTISLGVATAPAPNINTSDDLLERADRALYKSKRAGRNLVSLAQGT